MAIQLYTSAEEHVTLVLAQDPSIQRENEDAVLEAYIATGDDSDLSVPDDASRITVRPLTSRAVQYARRDADLAQWRMLQCSIERISDMSGVEPTIQGGMRLYPGEALDRLPAQVCDELLTHIARISGLGTAGKAS